MNKGYIIFTEMKYKGQWYCINPSTIVLEPTPHYRLIPTDSYEWSFGKEETFSQLNKHSHQIKPEEISTNLLNSLDDWGLTAYDLRYVIDEYTMYHLLEHTTENKSGFVLKTIVADYEAKKINDITEFVSADKYKKMDEELKKAYQYYEWKERYSWLDDLEAIKHGVENQQVFVDMVNEKDLNGDIRLLFFVPKNAT